MADSENISEQKKVFEDTVKNLEIEGEIKREIKQEREEERFVYHKNYSPETYERDLSLCTSNECNEDLIRIAGELGINLMSHG